MLTPQRFKKFSALLACTTLLQWGCSLVVEPTYRQYAPEAGETSDANEQDTRDPLEDADVIQPMMDVVLPEDGGDSMVVAEDRVVPPPNQCPVRGPEVCNNFDDDCDGIADNHPTDVGSQCFTDSGMLGTRQANCACVVSATIPEICYDNTNQEDRANLPDRCTCSVYYLPGVPANVVVGGIHVYPSVGEVRNALRAGNFGRPVVCMMIPQPSLDNVCHPERAPFAEPIDIHMNEQWVGGFLANGTTNASLECRPKITAPVVFAPDTTDTAALVNFLVESPPSPPNIFAIQMEGSGTVSRGTVNHGSPLRGVVGIGNLTAGMGVTRVVQNVIVNIRESPGDVFGVKFFGGNAALIAPIVSALGRNATAIRFEQTTDALVLSAQIRSLAAMGNIVGLTVENPVGPVLIRGLIADDNLPRASIGGAGPRTAAAGVAVHCPMDQRPVNLQAIHWLGARAEDAFGVVNDGCALSLSPALPTKSEVWGASAQGDLAMGLACRAGVCQVYDSTLRAGPADQAANVVAGVAVETGASTRIVESLIDSAMRASTSSAGIATRGSFVGDRLVIERAQVTGNNPPFGLLIQSGPVAQMTNSVVRAVRGAAVGIISEAVPAGTAGVLLHSNTFYQLSDGRDSPVVMIAVTGRRADGAAIRFINNIVAPTYSGALTPGHIGFCVENAGAFSEFDRNLASGGAAIFATGADCQNVQPDNVDGALTFLGPAGGMLFRGNALLEREHHINRMNSAAGGRGVLRIPMGDKDIDGDDRPNGAADIGADEIP